MNARISGGLASRPMLTAISETSTKQLRSTRTPARAHNCSAHFQYALFFVSSTYFLALRYVDGSRRAEIDLTCISIVPRRPKGDAGVRDARGNEHASW